MEKICPREYYLVIDPVQLHMLQAPALVDPLGYVFLPEPRQIWRVIHANFHALRAELRHEGASNDAHEGSGASRVPRSASVRMLRVTSGLLRSVSRIVEIFKDQS